MIGDRRRPYRAPGGARRARRASAFVGLGWREVEFATGALGE